MYGVRHLPAAPFYVLEVPEGYGAEYGEMVMDKWKKFWEGSEAPKLIVIHSPMKLSALSADSPYSYRTKVGDVEEEIHFATVEELMAWVKLIGRGAQG